MHGNDDEGGELTRRAMAAVGPARIDRAASQAAGAVFGLMDGAKAGAAAARVIADRVSALSVVLEETHVAQQCLQQLREEPLGPSTPCGPDEKTGWWKNATTLGYRLRSRPSNCERTHASCVESSAMLESNPMTNVFP